MAELVEDLDGVVYMVDDFLIHGKTQEEHDERLRRVLQRLSGANLTLNKDKCKFSVSEVSFWGQHVDGSGTRPDQEKVSAITNMPTPTNVPEVRRQ